LTTADELIRGSQFRVESMLLRLSGHLGYCAPSPSDEQRASMAPYSVIPLTLPPEEAFYREPVIVLDFTSLYPSMMIAYNYCYSTCLGNVRHLAAADKRQSSHPTHFDIPLGCLRYAFDAGILSKLSIERDLHISPTGVVFVKRHVCL